MGFKLRELLPSEHPRCPRCDNRMLFQRVDPGVRGYENRVFECGKCFTQKTEAVVIDPISRVRGWAASGLARPS
jgi:hypothetical protein